MAIWYMNLLEERNHRFQKDGQWFNEDLTISPSKQKFKGWHYNYQTKEFYRWSNRLKET